MFVITGVRYIALLVRYTLLLLGRKISFVLQAFWLHRGLLYRGFTVKRFGDPSTEKDAANCFRLLTYLLIRSATIVIRDFTEKVA